MVSNHSMAERIRGKGKGKEMLFRYEGEAIRPDPNEMGVGEMKEDEPVPSDPRNNTSIRRPSLIRKVNTELLPVKYEVSVQFFIFFYESLFLSISVIRVGMFIQPTFGLSYLPSTLHLFF